MESGFHRKGAQHPVWELEAETWQAFRLGTRSERELGLEGPRPHAGEVSLRLLATGPREGGEPGVPVLG